MMIPRASQRPRESWVATYQPCCTTASESQRIKTQKGCAGKGCWPHPRVRSLSWGGPGGHCRYPEDRVPPRTSIKSRQRLPPLGWGSSRAATCPRGSGSRLPARGSFGAATCPRGSVSRLPARGSSGAATCHLGSSTHLLAQGRSGAATCPKDGFCRLQANKQISPDDPAIMIFIGTCARVSSKTLRDKGCPARSQGVQQAAH
jgi:hypothetical protein